ncbi:hypothetical protein [Aerobium aerolatum]|uniref:Acetyl-CoA C-acetyltransferase n=1 Tax=Aquamicrobium aerolatum DSM 21857 TaxID=1121003 RepID=A0A1I3RI57_9HYPH|nr:hypothetical protein [Aquamicrobium aerolatum]SFJ44866.1 acetyl-CoA C-acetyltransferase [Aquamicrobium aerolatum DSM 21857]
MQSETYIIGRGHTKFGRLEQNLEELVVEAAQEALLEAEVAPASRQAGVWADYPRL